MPMPYGQFQFNNQTIPKFTVKDCLNGFKEITIRQIKKIGKSGSLETIKVIEWDMIATFLQ